MYPIVAPTPIQYQYGSMKTPRDFKTIIPNDSVELGGTYNTDISIYISANVFKINSPNLLTFMLTWLQLFPRNSLTAIAFWPYIIGETQ